MSQKSRAENPGKTVIDKVKRAERGARRQSKRATLGSLGESR